MARSCSSQLPGLRDRLEENCGLVERTDSGERAKGDLPLDVRERHLAAPSTMELSATQKKNKKRRERKKKAAADAAAVLETSHPSPSNGTDDTGARKLHTAKAPANRNIIIPYVEALMEDHAFHHEYIRAFKGVLPTEPDMTEVWNVMKDLYGEEIAARSERDMIRAILDWEDDLDAIPMTDLHDSELARRQGSMTDSHPPPYDWPLDSSLRANKLLRLRKSYYKRLSQPEHRAAFVAGLGAGVTDALMEDFRDLIAAAESGQLPNKGASREHGETLASDPLEWRHDVERFDELEDLEGVSHDILFGYHRALENGEYEWRPPGHAGKQATQQTSGVAHNQVQFSHTVLSTSATLPGPGTDNPGELTSYHSNLGLVPSGYGIMETKEESRGCSSESSPVLVTGQSPSSIPTPSLRLVSQQYIQTRRQLVSSRCGAQSMALGIAFDTCPGPNNAHSQAVRSQLPANCASTTTLHASEQFKVTKEMTVVPEPVQMRSDLETAKLEAELDALIADWTPLQPESHVPQPGGSSMVQVLADVLEPLCWSPKGLEEHREWLDNWSTERNAEQLAEPLPACADLPVLQADVATTYAEMRPEIEALSKPEAFATVRLSSEILRPLTALRAHMESMREVLRAFRVTRDTARDRALPLVAPESLLSKAKSEDERVAVKVAAAEREQRRAERSRQGAEHVHPITDRFSRVVWPQPEHRILTMERKAVEALTDRMCRAGALRNKVGSQSSTKALCLAQNASNKSVTS